MDAAWAASLPVLVRDRPGHAPAAFDALRRPVRFRLRGRAGREDVVQRRWMALAGRSRRRRVRRPTSYPRAGSYLLSNSGGRPLQRRRRRVLPSGPVLVLVALLAVG